MRIENILALAGTLLFAVGCDEVQRSATYGPGESPHQGQVMASSTYPPATVTYQESQTAPLTPTYSTTVDTDRDLCERVRTQLSRYNDVAPIAANLDITAQNGAVSLAGSVPTETQRQRIHSICRNTSGVLAVNDQLQVAPPPPANYSSAYPATPYGGSDQTIANQVQQALYSHPTASRCAQNVHIMVQGGRVTLTGNLGSEQDRQVVDECVRLTPGVIGVSDQMQIVTLPTSRPQEPARVYSPNGENFSLHVQGLNDADRDLAQRILEGMQNQNAVNRSWPGVNINVTDGRVVLQGTVQSYEEKRAILDSVQRAAGPNNVYDEIRVVR